MLDKLGWRKTDKQNATLEDRMQKLDPKSVPQHIAITMDGNGRWAQKRALPRIAGHHGGMKMYVRLHVVRIKSVCVP